MESCDILTVTQQLEESGMQRTGAEAVVRAVQSLVAPLATRAELAAEAKAIRGEIESSELKLTAKMHELAMTQTWRLIGAMFVMNSLFFALHQMYG